MVSNLFGLAKSDLTTTQFLLSLDKVSVDLYMPAATDIWFKLLLPKQKHFTSEKQPCPKSYRVNHVHSVSFPDEFSH